mgnify:CR=1 FL=1
MPLQQALGGTKATTAHTNIAAEHQALHPSLLASTICVLGVRAVRHGIIVAVPCMPCSLMRSTV